MATTDGNNTLFLDASNPGTVGLGLGNDRYVLSNTSLAANQTLTISDADGANTLQLVGGLTITSSLVSNNAIQLTLSNGAKVNVLGASTFTFLTGGDAFAGTGGVSQTFSQFVTTALGSTVPAAGATPVTVGSVTLVNPSAVVAPTFSVASSAAAAEGTSATFTVTLSAAQSAASTVAYTLAGTGGATLGTDTGTNVPAGNTGTLTFAAGEVTKTVVVPFTADVISSEAGEGVSITLSAPSAGTVLSTSAAAATVAITDVPVTYTLTSNAASVFEGAPIIYTLTASAASTTATTVNFSVTPGDSLAVNQGTSNTNLNDFAAGAFNPAAVVLAAGATTVTYTVTSSTDAITELPESYSVKAVIGTTTVATATTTLLDGVGTGVDSVGTTFSLTTNIDAPGATSPSVNTLGTSANDTYNAVLDATTAANNTLQALDNIDGAGGIDTLSIISNGANANTVTPLFLKNTEKVSVKDVDATGGIAVSTTTVNFTNATGVTEVINDGSIANVVLNNIGAAALTAKNLSTAGVLTTATLGTSPVTTPVVINLDKLGSVAVVGTAAVNAGRVVINDTNADNTAATINVAAGNVLIATDGGLATKGAAAINVSGQDSTGVAAGGLAAVFGTHTATALTINATGNLTVSAIDIAGGTATAAIQGFDTTKLGTITVTGAGAVNMGLLAGAVKTVNASAATGNVSFSATTYTGTEATGVASNGLNITTGSGNDSITLNAVATAVVAAGAGNDTVTVSAGLVAGAKIGGGDGTADRIVVTGAQAALLDDQDTAGTNLRATLTGFEQIGIGGALGVANNFNMALAGGYNYLALNGDVTGTATVSGFTSGATVEFRNAGAQTTALNIGVTDAALTSTDSVTLRLNADLSSGSNFAVIAGASGVNIVNVIANDRVNNIVDDNLALAAADNGRDDGYTLTLGDGATTSANVTNVNISGSSFVSYTVSAATNALKLIDASASTGNAVLDATNFAGTERLEIKGAQGTNTITGSATAFGERITGGVLADSINGLAGADDMTGGGGRDAFLFGAVGASGTTAATVDQITDFGLVTDVATIAEVGAMNSVANFQATATAKGGANADIVDFTTAPVVAAAAAAADVVVALEAIEVGDQYAGQTITVTESSKGLLTIGGANAAAVDTLGEWVVVANQAAGAAGNVVAFNFGGNAYLFQQVTLAGTADDTLVELTGVTLTGVVVSGGGVAAEAGNVFVI